MAAYGLAPRDHKEVGATVVPSPFQYNPYPKYKTKPHNAPFLSATPRETLTCGKMYTHAIYDAADGRKLTNPSPLAAKVPRFPYEAFSKEDLEEILCRCGIDNPCECTQAEEQEDEECHAKERRRLYVGPPPRSRIEGGLSCPSRRDRGFEIFPDGTQRRVRTEEPDECPPFYDARVNEATAFYQGWKWSQWKGQRAIKSLEVRPGPSDYTLRPREPNEAEKCGEQIRSIRKKYSKLLRYIEMIQDLDKREGRPGPAAYTPVLPKSTQMSYYGPKAERFPSSKYEKRPGPAEYSVKRCFSPPEIPIVACHAKLPEKPCFGIKAARFKPRVEEGPSPASYSANYKPCRFLNCVKAPFNNSAKRFKETLIEDSDSDEDVIIEEEETDNPCLPFTWQFKSKTIKAIAQPIVKKLDEPSPADLPQQTNDVKRSALLQYRAPFNSSLGKFYPWNNDLPVYGKLITPGPGYYNANKATCNPGVRCGPLERAARFRDPTFITPAPNEYKTVRNISDLTTHNVRLRKNMEEQHKFHFDPPVEPRILTLEERHLLLLEKAIAILEPYPMPASSQVNVPVKEQASDEKIKHSKPPKLLRCFLYRKAIPNYF